MIPWVLCSGLLIEPYIHPKPGGVTRLASHKDKSLADFLISNILYCQVINNLELNKDGCLIGNVFNKLLEILQDKKIKTNTSLGQWLLHTPLILAYYNEGSIRPDNLTINASKIIREADECDTRAYYKILKYFHPSHLGKLVKGNIDVFTNEKELPPMKVIVEFAANSDLVHKELLDSYPISREVSRVITDDILKGELCFESVVSKAFLELLSKKPDTLIARKRGVKTAYRIMRLAQYVQKGVIKIDELDNYMRKEEINPGTLLDILSASITLSLAQIAYY